MKMNFKGLARSLKTIAPVVMGVLAGAGVVAVGVMSAKAGAEAHDILKAKAEEKGEELDIQEKVETTWKTFAPATAIGVGTVALIAGAIILDKSSVREITAAYVMLDQTFKHYRKDIQEKLGFDVDKKALETAQKEAKSIIVAESVHPDDGEQTMLFHDPVFDEFFESSFKDIRDAENWVNLNLIKRGYSDHNEFASFAGEPMHEEGEHLGWAQKDMKMQTPFGQVFDGGWVEFAYNLMKHEDGFEYYEIEYSVYPYAEFID